MVPTHRYVRVQLGCRVSPAAQPMAVYVSTRLFGVTVGISVYLRVVLGSKPIAVAWDKGQT